ncbi:MAG: Tetrahydromethanopterin S-methyltransferase subunit F [Methanosaeta sp. PtaU1.Bin060]|jgi:tetrahydromethanopterin S-methyltransferase subunit F|nr:MAG: Tetrahydromethanopterin S-methyltransferase subunit F [Methanosaeta sp. PtaU1.Bin060]
MAEEQEEIVYGQGIPKVIEPRIPMFQDLTEDIKYKAQLLARETKLSSGVLSTVSMGFTIGFILAVVMMIGPFFVFKGGL